MNAYEKYYHARNWSFLKWFPIVVMCLVWITMLNSLGRNNEHALVKSGEVLLKMNWPLCIACVWIQDNMCVC